MNPIDFIDRLPGREAFVIKAHFGLGHDPMTHKEIGDLLKLSGERIRQLEQTGLRRLRNTWSEHERSHRRWRELRGFKS